MFKGRFKKTEVTGKVNRRDFMITRFNLKKRKCIFVSFGTVYFRTMHQTVLKKVKKK